MEAKSVKVQVDTPYKLIIGAQTRGPLAQNASNRGRGLPSDCCEQNNVESQGLSAAPSDDCEQSNVESIGFSTEPENV